MARTVKLSIILVNYKTLELTAQAVNTLVNFAPWVKDEAEIIVVDNNSQDGSYESLKSQFPWINVINNPVNSGFSGGNNVGLKIAQGKYILLLNTDTVSIEDPITNMIDWMDQNPEVGVATIQLLNEDKSIQETGGFFPTLPRVFTWMFFIDDVPFFSKFFKSFHPDSRSYNKEKHFYTKTRELDWITGAYFFMRKDIIEKVGLFDEKMFMYAEEMEYCYRIKKAHYKCFYVPVSKIIHLRGKSSASLRSPLLGELKNIVYFYIKHRSRVESILLKLLLKSGALLRIVAFGTILKKKEVAAIYAEALRTI